MSDLREALAEIVACKDLKDRLDKQIARDAPPPLNWITRNAEYARRLPLAWAAARAALVATAAQAQGAEPPDRNSHEYYDSHAHPEVAPEPPATPAPDDTPWQERAERAEAALHKLGWRCETTDLDGAQIETIAATAAQGACKHGSTSVICTRCDAELIAEHERSTPTPTPAALQDRLRDRVLARHGGQGDPYKWHWNLTDYDSLMHREAADALDRLTAIVDVLGKTRDMLAQENGQFFDRAERAQAQADALRVDAERYRTLRDGDDFVVYVLDSGDDGTGVKEVELRSPDELDAEVDEARAARVGEP